MHCPECKKLDQKSTVYEGSQQRTLMAINTFYDEDGKYHRHDRNTTTISYSCSAGHAWQEEFRSICWCEESITEEGE